MDKVTLKTKKRNKIKIAKELLYSKKYIKKLEDAKTIKELDVIMFEARQNAIKKDEAINYLINKKKGR